MKARCRSEELDGFLAGELSAAEAAEVEAHLSGCASCGHELAWLRAERELFVQRARRAEAPGWRELERRAEPAGPRWARRPRRWARAAAGLVAACAALWVVSGRLARHDELGALDTGELEATGSGELALSLDPRFVIASLEQRFGACLVATPNAASSCGPRQH